MEGLDRDHRILQDLALIYIALAHGTDEDLDDAEVATMAERLKAWEVGTGQGTVVSAIKEALDDYMQDQSDEKVNHAIRHIRDVVPQDLRALILDDLMAVALADDKFLYEEGSFIENLVRVWDVHPGAHPEEGRVGAWSVLGDGSGGRWTPVHDLTLLYLSLAHSTDDRLSSTEMAAITEKLREWMPGADEADVLDVVKEVLTVYVQGPDEQMLEEALASVREHVPAHQRAAILGDLAFVADADGTRLDEEQQIITRLAEAWGTEQVG